MEEGVELINKATEGREKEKAWQMWLVQYPNMTKENFIPFSEFYKAAVKPSEVSQKPAEDILKEANEIRRKLGR